MPPILTQQAATQPQTPAPVVTPVTPQVKAPETAVVAPVTKEDILKRVSQPVAATPVAPDAPKVAVSMDDIKDPAARAILEKRLVEANASIAKTFGEVGADKAKLMKQVEDLNTRLNQPWTPQRIQNELLARQDFIQSAQQIQAQAAPQGWQGTSEEWSGLSTSEKQQVQNLIASQNTLNQQMNAMLQSQIDSQLKTKYPDYEVNQIDNFYRESMEGRVAPDRLREMIYKALNYDTHVNRAYEFATQDKLALNQERVNGMAPNSAPATLSPSKPEKLPTESNQSWMSKVAKWNLANVASYRANQRQ